MKRILRNSISLFGVAFLLLLVVVSSCKKDKTCYGKVYVVDSAGVAVPEATVTIDTTSLPAPTAGNSYNAEFREQMKKQSDGSGVASFEFKTPAILNMNVSKGALLGKGVLRVDEPGKTGKVTIEIR